MTYSVFQTVGSSRLAMRLLSSFLLLFVCVTTVRAWGIKASKPKPTAPEFCAKPPFSGSCQPITKPWHYDAASKHCQQISSGLCSAGSNRFLSEEKCKTVCEPLTKNIPGMCLKPPLMVACGQVRHAWYFDRNSNSCKMLSYTDPACDSAGNRFLTELKCQGVCLPNATPKPICSRDPEPDTCLLSRKKWFFNFSNNTCMIFKNGCGKGPNSFASYGKCMSKCSYNQVTAASPTGKQELQNEHPPLGKPGVPNQVGTLSPTTPPVQPSIPVQPGQPSKPGLALPNQPGHSGLPLQSVGSGQPGQPSLTWRPGQASSTLPPSIPAQSGQSSSRPGTGLPGQQGISTQSRGPGQPNQIGLMGKPGQVNHIFPPSTSAQSAHSSGAGVGLPSHLGQQGRPSTRTPSLSGQPSGHGFRLPGPAGPPLLPGPTGKAGVSIGPGSRVQPGFGGSTIAPSTPAVSGPSITHGVGKTGLPGVSGTITQASPNTLPSSPIAPNQSVSTGVSLSPGVAFQNNQSSLSSTARQPRVEKQFRPYRSTNR
ncbi:collagen alpha-2(IV) chain-like [Dermacentor silvarum]|uniref:collagen alpha-2(IV) chain-like n=1 Tax=Dermacentor silvarum TaxID=543639 RepID=UPI0021017FDA|nr:collagen alpha-2(IV) chain-like [Dermacentor silvarum]